MAKSRKQKETDAFDLFLRTDMNQKQICEIVGWSERTFTTKKKEGNWEALKEAASVSSAAIIGNLYKQAHELSLAEKVDADKLIKIAKSIEMLSDNKVTASHYINVFKGFTSWLIGQDKELARTVNGLQQKFLIDFINE